MGNYISYPKLTFDSCTRIDGETTALCEVKKFYLYLSEPDWSGYNMEGEAFIVNAIIEDDMYNNHILGKRITIFLISRNGYESTIRSFRIVTTISKDKLNDKEITTKDIVRIIRDEFERIRIYENNCGEFGDYPMRPRAKCLREFLGDNEKWTIVIDCVSKMNYLLGERSEKTK